MKTIYSILFTVLLLGACNSGKGDQTVNEVTVESLKASIKEIDDSLELLMAKALATDGFEIDRLVYHEGANRGIEFYKNFPDDEYAPYAVDKVIGMYWALNIEPRTVEWLDTFSFDAYNPKKIEYYTKLMLNRNDLSPEKRADFELRLKHIDKSFEDFILILNESDENAPVEVEFIN